MIYVADFTQNAVKMGENLNIFAQFCLISVADVTQNVAKMGEKLYILSNLI